MARDLRSTGSCPSGHAPTEREASPVDPSRSPSLDDEIQDQIETLHTCAPTSVKERARDRLSKLIAKKELAQ